MLRELGRLSTALSAVRTLDDSMPVQTLAVFLEVAKNPQISVTELATKCGLAQSSASRNVAALSDWHWLKKPGLGLVITDLDPMDMRKKFVKLTPKGQKLVDNIVTVMKVGGAQS
jgi:DNA-binding MarR family transcriptional regulator